MSAQAACDECGWRGTPTTHSTAADRAARHTCEAHLTRLARRRRVARRRSERAARPHTPCQHTQVTHAEGTRQAYVLDGCRCAPCTDANLVYERARGRAKAYGRPTTTWVDAQPAREHVRALMAAGIGLKRVTALSGVGGGQLTHLLYGKAGYAGPAKRLKPENAAALLAVRADQHAPRALVDATGTRRRVEGLSLAGWSPTRVAAAAGVTRQTLDDVLAGGVTTAATRDAVTAAARRLLTTDPTAGLDRHGRGGVTRTRAHATAHGWVPLLAWDDIDDPTEQQQTTTTTSKAEARAALVEDVEWLVRTGATWDSATARTGRTRDHLTHQLQQAGRADLVHALAAATRGEVAA